MELLTKALLKDLQNDLDDIKKLDSDVEVMWALNRFKQNTNFAQKAIEKKNN